MAEWRPMDMAAATAATAAALNHRASATLARDAVPRFIQELNLAHELVAKETEAFVCNWLKSHRAVELTHEKVQELVAAVVEYHDCHALTDDERELRFPRIYESIDGSAPLFSAVQASDALLVTALLHYGADPHARQGGNTPLFVASQRGATTVVRALCEGGAQVNVTCGPMLSTPLCIASHRGHAAVVRELVDAKADVEARQRDGSTPLYLAVKAGHERAARELLDLRANPNAVVASRGLTPLHRAAAANQSGM
eukprot:6213732-Pleurochrysis_carterae.AAC.1